MKAPFLLSQKANKVEQPDDYQCDRELDDNRQRDDFQRWIDGIPGAVSQLITTLEGLAIAYPYISAGC